MKVENILRIEGFPVELSNNKHFNISFAVFQERENEFKEKYWEISEASKHDFIQTDLNWKSEIKLSNYLHGELALLDLSLNFPVDIDLKLLSTSKFY